MSKDEPTYIIYIHTAPSVKRYIGITKQSPTERWGKDGNRYQRCTAFWRAIQKYGWDNITHEIIDTADTLSEANEKEQKYIDQYKTTDKNFGYNLTEGGDGVTGWNANEEQREKNSKAKKEMWQNPKMRERLTRERQERGSSPEERERLLSMNKANWEDPEMREKLSEHLRDLANNKEYRKRRSANMKSKWDDDEEFKSKMLSVLEKNHQDKDLHERHSQAMKQQWAENREKFLVNRHYLSGADNPTSKTVRCIELDMVFPTAREAERATGVSYKSISNVVRGKSKTAGGYHWEFVKKTDDSDNN